MAVKASNQMTLVDLTDAYSVTLTNENYTFLGDTDSVNGTQSTTTKVMALCGSEQVACKVGTITTGVSGITAVSDGKSPVPTITITATSSLTKGGSFDIPIEIGTEKITLTKTFSYAIAFTGKTGATGRGISSTVVEYQQSDSGTTPPTGSWASSPPAPTAGKYLWTRTTITYTSGSPATSVLYSVSRSGTNGAAGKNGRGIKTITNYYLASSKSSGVTAEEITSTDVPTLSETNRYLWNYEKIDYDDSTSSQTEPVIIGVHGAKGATGSQGAAGRGIKSITEYYLVSSKASGVTVAGETWVTAPPATTTTNKYLWNYEKITYTSGNPTSEDTTPRIIGTHGATGAKGATGAAGADAISLVITSSGGTIFKNSQIATTLTAHVYKAGSEVTGGALTALGTIKWYKDGSDTALTTTGATLTISAGDVDNQAVYVAQLEG